jgi:hypothetical protein
MLFIKKESAWTFTTSGTGGIGIEFVVVEGGSIYLKDPRGNDVTFRYGGAGAGLSVGFKLPKIGKIDFKFLGKSVGLAIAPAAFPNWGALYILDSFKGDELTRSDITGVCMFVEAGLGFFAGFSGTAMLLGMDPILLAASLAATGVNPALGLYVDERLVQSAKAVLVMAGFNVGLIAGGGGAALLGGLF